MVRLTLQNCSINTRPFLEGEGRDIIKETGEKEIESGCDMERSSLMSRVCLVIDEESCHQFLSEAGDYGCLQITDVS